MNMQMKIIFWLWLRFAERRLEHVDHAHSFNWVVWKLMSPIVFQHLIERLQVRAERLRLGFLEFGERLAMKARLQGEPT
jgi:hypothetical protein